MGEEVFGEFVVAGRDPAKMFDLVEEALDQIALSVKRMIDRTLDIAVAAGRDVGPSAATFYQIDDGAGVVAAVCDEVATWLESIDQDRGDGLVG